MEYPFLSIQASCNRVAMADPSSFLTLRMLRSGQANRHNVPNLYTWEAKGFAASCRHFALLAARPWLSLPVATKLVVNLL